ncbi:InlB B-repeat-containing protein [Dysosmobacter sp. Sow4_B12]|uniref:InlB B-repeat-containing protein n=1 Tax=Dysosmobacter sp. Sow4_B12 TaxID=3438777 RepID=UPI003F917B6B
MRDNTQVLAISSFHTTKHVSNGALLVEVEFTNQVSTVTYSAGGDGSLTAKTSQGTAVQTGASLAYGASVIFTAEPGEGRMVKEWKVAVNGETAKTYTWPESGEAYRENVLTLSDLAENSYTVYVEFTPKQTFTVASPVFVDGSGNPVNAGTITMTDADGKQISSGSALEQGKAITYTVSFNDSSFNTVNSWEYSTDGTNWSSASGSTGTTYTCCKGSTGTLYVRAVVSVAQTYALTWKVTGLAADDQATLSASSGGRDLTNGGSYAVNTPVSFHLEVDGKYYVTAWTNAEQSASDPASATLTLTKDTEVTVTVAKKPTVSWDASSITGGTISVKGTVNGTVDANVNNGGYVDPNTTITVTATPDHDYVVENINDAAVNTGKANGSVEANAVAVPADGLSVTASFLAKPTVTINSAAGGTVTVTGTKDGTANATITDGSYVDYNTTVTVTLKPSEGYEVSSGINADYTDGDGSSTDDKFYTISNVQADQTITPAWTALKEYTIVYSVVDTNGDAEGGKNGTLSASASRKDMASFSVYEFDEVYEGSTISFTAEPDEDYCVKEWTVEMDGTTTHPMGADDKLVLENISADADVTVQFTYLGSKVIASAGENGKLVSALVGENDVLRSITGNGILLNGGVSVQLTAEPDEGYEVESWLVNGKAVSGERETTYTHVADGSGARIAVTFRPVKYSVSWSAEDGTVKAAGYSGSSASIRGGTKVTFTAVPDDGYVVGGWAVNGKNQSGQTGSTFTWTVPAGAAEGTEYEIEAILVGGTYGVTVTDPAHGTISAEPDVTDGVTGGTSVTFTANAEDGYIVVGWTVNGKTTMSRSNTHTVTIKGDTTVTAVVVPEKYEVAYSVNESAGGTISAEGYDASPAAVPYDDSVTFTAVPDTGAYYYIQAWQVDGQTVTNGTDGVSISADKTTLTLSNVTSVHTVNAIFAKMTAYSVSYQVIGSGGSLNVVVDGKPLILTPGQSADVWGNSALVFTARPAENNMVKEWKINGVVQENLSNTLTIDALKENALVTVEFETPATMRAIPDNGIGYTISNIIKTPSDYGTAYEIRDRGTVTFTVAPDSGKYLTELKVNGIDCLTSTGTSGSENKLTIRNNGNGSYTITVANVKQDIALAATALEFQAFTEELSTVPTELQDKYTTVAELQNALRTEVKQIDSNVPNSQTALFDIVLKYTEDGITWVEADKNHFPAGGITVFIPYSDLGNTDSSYTFTVIHMFTTNMNGHRIGDTERITPATTKTGIQFTVTSLSPFAIGWSKYSAPSGGGGGGGGAAAPAETVIIKDSVNGKVTANNTSAEEDDVVTLTVEPDKGYTLETLTVTDKNGNELKLKDKGNGKYTFTMPDSKVTVKATFMEDNSMLNFFVDVSADAYYYDAVLWAAKEGITGGTDATHFSPNATCTRAQAVTFLWRAAGSPAPKSHAMPFTDVAEGSYYHDAVLWAVENGITKGTSDTTFTPNAKCTRAQIVTFLWRSQKSPASGSVNPFTDVAADAYYANAVLWAVENGITAGTTAATFSPNNDCTRAQIVTFLYRCMK